MTAADKLDQRLNEAIAHHGAGRLARAEAIYAQLEPLAPRNATLAYLRGQIAEEQGRPADAIRLYTRACQLDPRAASAAVRLASVLVSVGRAADAETVLRRALVASPKSHVAWNALGFVSKVRGRLGDAIACHQRAVELDSRYTHGWCQLGLTLGAAGRNFQALRCFDRALGIDPGFAVARYGRAQSLHKCYRINEAVAEYDAFLGVQPDHVEARSFRLFALQNLELPRERLFAEHQAYGRALGTAAVAPVRHGLSPAKRLRVAILSPDLRTHSCAFFLEPLLRHLDRNEFEVYLYHDHFVEDAMSAQLRALGAVWRNFVGLPHATVEATIRADQPDILVDLNAHIGNTVRLPLFARRLAPVQVTYLGYPDTTGVPNMDFRLTDAVADPLGDADRFATETLVRFAPTAWAYQPPADAPLVTPPPAASGAPVTFGCFNSPTKFSDGLLAAWSRLLQCVPGSRLLLKGRDFDEPEVRDALLSRFETHGISIGRLQLLSRTPDTASHLAQYAQVDIALDTFPYNGTTTTCEALWMGRPVVTLAGDRHAARVGASLLTAAGHPQWIAATADEYVRIAAGLAAAPATLAAQSSRLRADLQGSALLDHAAQSARFAAALRGCWRETCAAATGASPAVEVAAA